MLDLVLWIFYWNYSTKHLQQIQWINTNTTRNEPPKIIISSITYRLSH